MKKLILILLFCFSFADAQLTVPEYQSQSSFTSHVKAAGKEIATFTSCLFRKKVVDNHQRDARKRAIVLVHGLWASPSHMKVLMEDLKAEGYEIYTISLSYMKNDGFRQSVSKIQSLVSYVLDKHSEVDLIAHSLGGVAVVDAVNRLGEMRKRIHHVITINSPLRGTTVVNGFTRFFLPRHLGDVLKCESPFIQDLQRGAMETYAKGVLFFHTATESDHLVRALDTCFLPRYEEGIIITDEGHLSTLENPHVRHKIVEWLARQKPVATYLY